jgi:hypothetical protein
MNTINLYLSVKLTSQSPDGQLISLGIVSAAYQDKTAKESFMEGFCTGISVVKTVGSKSFYAEFTDFDINRCDDWVKENVVSKLPVRTGLYCKLHPPVVGDSFDDHVISNTNAVKLNIERWLSQFSDYQIQFVIDSDYWGWCKFLELIGEWEEKEKGYCSRCGYDYSIDKIKVGSPKLPENIISTPIDIRYRFANEIGIALKDAFEQDLYGYVYGGVWIVPECCVPENMTNAEFLKELKEKNREVVYRIKEGFEDCKPQQLVAGENMRNYALFDAITIMKVWDKLIIKSWEKKK